MTEATPRVRADAVTVLHQAHEALRSGDDPSTVSNFIRQFLDEIATESPQRHTADTITDPALEALYSERDQLEAAVDYTRAALHESAVAYYMSGIRLERTRALRERSS